MKECSRTPDLEPLCSLFDASEAQKIMFWVRLYCARCHARFFSNFIRNGLQIFYIKRNDAGGQYQNHLPDRYLGQNQKGN